MMNNDSRKKRLEIAVIIGRITTGLIAIFLPPSDEILSFNVVWLLCIGVFAFAQGELEHNAGRKGFSWMTIGCFVLGILINIGTGTGDMLGGMIGLASMIILYILGKEYALHCKK